MWNAPHTRVVQLVSLWFTIIYTVFPTNIYFYSVKKYCTDQFESSLWAITQWPACRSLCGTCFSSDVFLDWNFSRLLWVSHVSPEPSTVSKPHPASKPTGPAGGGGAFPQLCNLRTTVVLATQYCHSNLLPTSYNWRGKRETPVLTDTGGAVVAEQDVRHLQSVLAHSIVVLQWLYQNVCTWACVCVYVCVYMSLSGCLCVGGHTSYSVCPFYFWGDQR